MGTLSIHSLLPDAEALLDLEPEELAGVLLEYLNSLPPSEEQQLNRHNFFLSSTKDYPQDREKEVRQALMEAWVWLEHEGLLVPNPDQSGEWVVISRRGRELETRDRVSDYRHANLLPRQQLHLRIAHKGWATFLRREYDTAVFQAFREVEVRVREAGQFAEADYGASLMRDAFRKGGPLRDNSAPESEEDSLSHLFAGAMGYFKNPSSHRNVSIEPREAVKMIMLASHLLGIVDKRSPADSAA